MPANSMNVALWQVSQDVRSEVVRAIRQHDVSLTEDAAAALAGSPGLDAASWRECAAALVRLFTAAIESGDLDPRRGALHDLCRFSPPAAARQIIRSIHTVEPILLEELAIHDRLGATSDSWPLVAHVVRSAAFEIAAACAERDGGRSAVRDPLTTLMSPHVFRLALEQETARANRHEHGLSALLFDIDDLSSLNSALGFGAGDRLLERLGILARRFFRNHDWVARHGDDSIAVLLPETTLDQAGALANRFREMVQQRIVLTDHRTDLERRVTVSAAAVGAETVQVEIDAGYIMSELEAAVLRGKLNGGNRTETVALLPTSVTILGAATLMGTSAREVITLIRQGALRATRRGRHYHIDRVELEDVKRRFNP